MTIDERLERLTERHEALTQSLELLSHMHQENERENEKRMARVDQVLSALAEAQVKTEEAMARLAHIADIPDHRITRLEDRPQ
jgi:chromosome condensin MukBEF ATPase and DNA-binding subunit MukB